MQSFLVCFVFHAFQVQSIANFLKLPPVVFFFLLSFTLPKLRASQTFLNFSSAVFLTCVFGAPQVKGVYCFQVKGGPGGKEAKWIVDAKNGSGAVIRDGTGEPGIYLSFFFICFFIMMCSLFFSLSVFDHSFSLLCLFSFFSFLLMHYFFLFLSFSLSFPVFFPFFSSFSLLFVF